MAFISEIVPLKHGIDFGYGEEPKEADTVSTCGCFRGFCAGIRPRRKRSPLSSCVRSQHLGDGPEVRYIEEGVVKDARSCLGDLCSAKWKIVVRNFRSKGTGKKRAAQASFQYDVRSHALNFEDGIDRGQEENTYFSFSARYAAPARMNAGQTFGS